MAEVYNLTSSTLDDATHDINGCIVTVKERSGSNNAHLVFWHVRGLGFHGSVMYLGP